MAENFPRRRRILVVQSDESKRNRIAEQLNRMIPAVRAIGSAADCYKILKQEAFALAVIDEDLSDESGYVLARFIRMNTIVPVLMLIGEATHEKRMASYLAGATACVERQYVLQELPLLVSNILDVEISQSKTGPGTEGPVKKSSEWILHRHGWALTGTDGEKVRLTINEYEFIVALVNAKPEPATRNELLERFGYDHDARGNKSLEAMVHRIRQKVSATGNELIVTAHGVGWALSVPVAVQ